LLKAKQKFEPILYMDSIVRVTQNHRHNPWMGFIKFSMFPSEQTNNQPKKDEGHKTYHEDNN
jgi:hypothetical protein